MSFTPGPWESETEYECAVYAHNHQMKIADIRGWGYLTGKGQGGLGLSSAEASKIQNANARLIAAAPEMFEFIKEIKENHLEPGLFIEKVEADWIRIMTPIVDFLLKHTPALVDALARTIVVEGYGEGGGVVNPDAHIFTDTKAALQRFKDTWAWMVRAHKHRGIKSRLEKAVTLLKRIEGEEESA